MPKLSVNKKLKRSVDDFETPVRNRCYGTSMLMYLLTCLLYYYLMMSVTVSHIVEYYIN